MSGFQASGMCLRGFGLSTAFGRKNHSEKLGQRRNVGVQGDGRGRPAPSVTDMRTPRGPPACPRGDAGTPAAASWPGGSGRRSCRGCGPRRGAVSPGRARKSPRVLAGHVQREPRPADRGCPSVRPSCFRRLADLAQWRLRAESRGLSCCFEDLLCVSHKKTCS